MAQSEDYSIEQINICTISVLKLLTGFDILTKLGTNVLVQNHFYISISISINRALQLPVLHIIIPKGIIYSCQTLKSNCSLHMTF